MKEVTLEYLYISKAMKYKLKKDECKWWQFKKKAEISTKIKTCINLAAMYGVNFPDRKVYCNENDLL